MNSQRGLQNRQSRETQAQPERVRLSDDGESRIQIKTIRSSLTKRTMHMVRV